VEDGFHISVNDDTNTDSAADIDNGDMTISTVVDCLLHLRLTQGIFEGLHITEPARANESAVPAILDLSSASSSSCWALRYLAKLRAAISSASSICFL